jgi:hypothetical protein
LQTTSLSYKLIKKIKDERFDEELIHQYHLLIGFSTRDVQVVIIEPTENRVLLLEDYVLPAVNSHQELVSLLSQLFDAHALLRAGFWKKIKISIKNQKFVQVPTALFIPESMAEYLKFNAHAEVDDDFIATSNPQAEAVTIFAINRELKNWLLSVYPNNTPIFVHQSAALIEGVLTFAKNRSDNPLYIYVDRFKLHILSCSGGKLIYYNQFAIKQFSDYVKYIMLVMKSLNLNQQTSQVVLWGYIGKNSPHYQEFYKYINNVMFGELPSYLHFSYMFDEVQEHHFFDTYSMHLLGE